MNKIKDFLMGLLERLFYSFRGFGRQFDQALLHVSISSYRW
jgi:hypothetical protein